VFKNKIAEEVVALERRPQGAKFEELKGLVSGARGKVVYENGDSDHGIWSAGTCMGLIKDIPTCEDLVRRIEYQAELVIDGLTAMRTQSAKL